MSINILSLDTRSEWLSGVKSELHKYQSIIPMPVELLINQLVRGEVEAFNVNDEMVALAHRYLNGNDLIFYVVFAYGIGGTGFFSFRNKLSRNWSEVTKYVKQVLGCSRLETMAGSNAHAIMYKSALTKAGNKVKHESYFRVIL